MGSGLTPRCGARGGGRTIVEDGDEALWVFGARRDVPHLRRVPVASRPPERVRVRVELENLHLRGRAVASLIPLKRQLGQLGLLRREADAPCQMKPLQTAIGH